MARFSSPARGSAEGLGRTRHHYFERFGANRFQELNNYSDRMTRSKCDDLAGSKRYAPAAASDDTSSRRHQGPARRRIRPATIRLANSPTGCPKNMKLMIKASAQPSAGSS